MWITKILAVLLCLSAGCCIYQKRKTYRMIDRLLDSVLSRETVVHSDVEEGEYSALVSKINQIQRVLDNHAKSAEKEKEQVKSLVSDMSHQLKTPLANLSLYADILGRGKIEPGQREEFAGKMHRQVERLNWIVESLSKMVKLEQNIDGFEVRDTQIRQTILDAVDTVYEKMESKKIDFILEPFEDMKLYHNRKWTAEVFVNLLENAVKYNLVQFDPSLFIVRTSHDNALFYPPGFLEMPMTDNFIFHAVVLGVHPSRQYKNAVRQFGITVFTPCQHTVFVLQLAAVLP